MSRLVFKMSHNSKLLVSLILFRAIFAASTLVLTSRELKGAAVVFYLFIYSFFLSETMLFVLFIFLFVSFLCLVFFH